MHKKPEFDSSLVNDAMGLLGESVLGQKRYAEAEPLILSAYKGMITPEAKLPGPAKARLNKAAERVVRLYEAWDKPEKAAEWRTLLGMPPRNASMPTGPDAFSR